MALCGLFSALLAICAWISVPLADAAVTLQTFGVFLCLGTLGGKRGTTAILVYLLLGAVGLPVFSGFRGGFEALLGTTGGYLTGVLVSGLLGYDAHSATLVLAADRTLGRRTQTAAAGHDRRPAGVLLLWQRMVLYNIYPSRHCCHRRIHYYKMYPPLSAAGYRQAASGLAFEPKASAVRILKVFSP